MEEIKICPKCGGEMEEGYVRDVNLAGIYKFFKEYWFKSSDKLLHKTVTKKVTTYCCKLCGYLESFAK